MSLLRGRLRAERSRWYVSETQGSESGASRAVVVWWFRGRLPQYEDQIRGLLKALEAQRPLRVYAAPVVGAWRAWRSILHRQYPAADLPDPDILIGAGRETHPLRLCAFAVIALASKKGRRSVAESSLDDARRLGEGMRLGLAVVENVDHVPPGEFQVVGDESPMALLPGTLRAPSPTESAISVAAGSESPSSSFQ